MNRTNPTGLRGGPARRMAPYHRIEGLRPAVHPNGIVTKPNTRTSDMQRPDSGKGSGSLSGPTVTKREKIDTGAKDDSGKKAQARKGLNNKKPYSTIGNVTVGEHR
jgi:hypothetical protein